MICSTDHLLEYYFSYQELQDLASRLKEAEVIKEKYCQQEDLKEELEGFATQELAKVKHMVSCISSRNVELSYK